MASGFCYGFCDSVPFGVHGHFAITLLFTVWTSTKLTVFQIRCIIEYNRSNSFVILMTDHAKVKTY